MKLLLDTHALLWFLTDAPSLSSTARVLIEDGANDIMVSPASYWEIAIKISLGKYHLPEPLAEFMERELTANNMTILPVTPRHAGWVSGLPFHHRDPFDRLITAQALAENVPLLSVDRVFDMYTVQRIW